MECQTENTPCLVPHPSGLCFKGAGLEGPQRPKPKPLQPSPPEVPIHPPVSAHDCQRGARIVALTCAWAGDGKDSLPLPITTGRTPRHFGAPEQALSSPVSSLSSSCDKWHLAESTKARQGHGPEPIRRGKKNTLGPREKPRALPHILSGPPTAGLQGPSRQF